MNTLGLKIKYYRGIRRSAAIRARGANKKATIVKRGRSYRRYTPPVGRSRCENIKRSLIIRDQASIRGIYIINCSRVFGVSNSRAIYMVIDDKSNVRGAIYNRDISLHAQRDDTWRLTAEYFRDTKSHLGRRGVATSRHSAITARISALKSKFRKVNDTRVERATGSIWPPK